MVSKLLFCRIWWPYLKRTQGIGNMANDRKPRRLVAQSMPRRLYTASLNQHELQLIFVAWQIRWGYSLCKVNNGNAAPEIYLTSPFAANAEAPFSGPYTSTKYKPAAVKMHRFAHANGIVARTGLTQWISALAVQANQERPIGKPKLPIMATYERCSGATNPPLPSLRLLTCWG